MRAKELFEDYTQQLESDLNNLLIGAKGSGATNVSTQAVVNQLQGMGYSVDVNSIITALQGNPIVTGVNPQTIQFTSPEASSSAGQTQDSAGRVGDMAQKATKI